MCDVCALLGTLKCCEFKQTRTSSRSNCESGEGSQLSPRLLQILIVFRGGSVLTSDVVFFSSRQLSFAAVALLLCHSTGWSFGV